MCLHDAKVCVRELFGKNKQEIDCWKVVRKGTTNRTKNNIYPIFFKINKKYDLGKVYQSDRKNKKINEIEDSYYLTSIYKGVHVFTSYMAAKQWMNEEELIIKVKCQRSDYIGHNKEKRQAVFMAIKFPKEIVSD